MLMVGAIDNSLLLILQMGLLAGMLHSLDADHMAAVAGISSSTQSSKHWPRFSLQWAAGHGAALLLVAILVFVLGMAIPFRFSALAEHAVAYTLIAIGAAAWFQLLCEYSGRPRRQYLANKAAWVGLLHGCAGSAPLLALLPASQSASPVWGLAYVLIFCLGVLLAMLALAKVIAFSVRNFHSRPRVMLFWLRPLLASVSLLLGVYLAIVA